MTKNTGPSSSRPASRDRFAKLGGRKETADQLENAVLMCGFTHLEVHPATGPVLSGTLGQLNALLAAAAAMDCDYRVIGLAPENAGRRHVTIYGDLVADEEAPRRLPWYQRRYCTPPEFHALLLAGEAMFLHPDDYCHRLREITAALAAAGPGRARGSIKEFYRSALAYRVGDLQTATLPVVTEVYVNKRQPSMQDSETLKFIELGNPTTHLVKPAPNSIGEDDLRITPIVPPKITENVAAPRLIPYSQPIPIKVPPQPRVPFKIVPSPTQAPQTEPPAKIKPAPTEPNERSLAQPGQTTMAFDC